MDYNTLVKTSDDALNDEQWKMEEKFDNNYDHWTQKIEMS